MTTNLAEQTAVLLGGSAGIGLETARPARAEGADLAEVRRHVDEHRLLPLFVARGQQLVART